MCVHGPWPSVKEGGGHSITWSVMNWKPQIQALRMGLRGPEGHRRVLDVGEGKGGRWCVPIYIHRRIYPHMLGRIGVAAINSTALGRMKQGPACLCPPSARQSDRIPILHGRDTQRGRRRPVEGREEGQS